eukprot:PLAT6900.1.p1 GENE.PLAT6900.1~~PLAT6900.1.p1  ORF type:complete len:837 (+),score=349.24 PLAT6900.1:222-2513(+)
MLDASHDGSRRRRPGWLHVDVTVGFSECAAGITLSLQPAAPRLRDSAPVEGILLDDKTAARLHRRLHGRLLPHGALLAVPLRGAVHLWRISVGGADSDSDSDSDAVVAAARCSADSVLSLSSCLEDDDAGLLHDALAAAVSRVSSQLRLYVTTPALRPLLPQHTLLCGSGGVGKTAALCRIAVTLRRQLGDSLSVLQRSMMSVAACDDDDPRSLSSLAAAAAAATLPTVLLLDDLHVCAGDEHACKLLTRLFAAAARAPLPFCVVAATRAAAELPSALLRDGALQSHVTLPQAGQAAREQLLRALLPREDWAVQLADRSAGYSCRDLMRLLRRADMYACQRSSHELCWDDCERALMEVQPSLMVDMDARKPAVAWHAFAGGEEVKARLLRLVSWRFHHVEALERLGAKGGAGVLLHGPSGCGKTLLAQALATRCNAQFVSTNAAQLLSKYVGDSEAAVRTLFSRARAAAPCVLLLDEIDAIASNRADSAPAFQSSGGEQSSGSSARPPHARRHRRAVRSSATGGRWRGARERRRREARSGARRHRHARFAAIGSSSSDDDATAARIKPVRAARAFRPTVGMTLEEYAKAHPDRMRKGKRTRKKMVKEGKEEEKDGDGVQQKKAEAASVGKPPGKASTSVMDRVLSTLLNELDGVEALQGVVVIAATNRKAALDSALTRPGRLLPVAVQQPSGWRERAAVLQAACKDRPLAEDVDLDDWACDSVSLGWSAARLAGLCRRAAFAALRDRAAAISNAHFQAAAKEA